MISKRLLSTSMLFLWFGSPFMAVAQTQGWTGTTTPELYRNQEIGTATVGGASLNSRFSHLPNVVDDYGASITGADSRAAIQACLDKGDVCYLPPNPGTGAAATATVTSATVASVSVGTAGSGYLTPPMVKFLGGQGSGAAIHVTTADMSGGAWLGTVSGGITAGSGYVNGVATLVAYGGSCTVMPAGTVTITSGGVSGVTMTTAGSGCDDPPAFSVIPGTVAAGHATISAGGVASVVVDIAGTGYTSTPAVIFEPPPITYVISGALKLKSNATLYGPSWSSVTLKLAAGANSDVLQCANVYALWDTQTNASQNQSTDNITIYNLTIDGGASAASGPFNTIWDGTTQTGDPDLENGLACYGQLWNIHNNRWQNIRGNGWRTSFQNTGGGNVNSLGQSFVHDNTFTRIGRRALWVDGPHDLQINNILISDACLEADNTWDGIYQQGGNWQFNNLHVSSTGTGNGNRCRTPMFEQTGFVTVVQSFLEGGRQGPYFGGDVTLSDSIIFAVFPNPTTKCGDAMLTLAANQNRIVNNKFKNTSHACIYGIAIGTTLNNGVTGSIIANNTFENIYLGPVDFLHDGGNNHIEGVGYTQAGVDPVWSFLTSGQTYTPGSTDTGIINTNTNTIASLTTSIPHGTSSGQVYLIGTSGAITSLSLSGTSGDTLSGCPTTLAANSIFIATYAGTTWTCASTQTVDQIGFNGWSATDEIDLTITGPSALDVKRLASANFNAVEFMKPIAYANQAYISATTNGSFAPTVTTGGFRNTNTSSVSNFTINFPRGQFNQQDFYVYSDGPITSINYTAATGETISGGPSSLSAGGSFDCRYRLTGTTWKCNSIVSDLTSPGAIGSSSPGTGAFTTLTHGQMVWSSGIQRTIPANASTVTVAGTTSLLVLAPSGSLTSLTISLPTPSTTATELVVVCENSVSGITYSGATVAGAPASCSTSAPFSLIYDGTVSSYYRLH